MYTNRQTNKQTNQEDLGETGTSTERETHNLRVCLLGCSNIDSQETSDTVQIMTRRSNNVPVEQSPAGE